MSKYITYLEGGPFNALFINLDDDPPEIRIRIHDEAEPGRVRVPAAVYVRNSLVGNDDAPGGRKQRAYTYRDTGEFLPSLVKDLSDVV